MPIEISPYTISKLESEIPEIRTRALDTIRSKLLSCRTDLDDLIVNGHDLTKNLLKWFRHKPLSHEKQIFEILLLLLKSKYRDEVTNILQKTNFLIELRKIPQLLQKPALRNAFDDIVDILNSHTGEGHETERVKDGLDTAAAYSTSTNRLPIAANQNENDAEDVNANDKSNNFSFDDAWTIPESTDLKSLKLLQSSLNVNVDQADLDYALQYFMEYITDFPGEYFLQDPFIFASLLQLFKSTDPKVNHRSLHSCCLELTKNLERRVTMRRLAKTFHNSDDAKQSAQRKKQVTIGTYCYETFRTVLGYLQDVYAEMKLNEINECFLILIEVIELICKTACVYTPVTAKMFHIDQIIDELGDFLKFIRESTQNYRQNEYKVNRNNAISVIFLLCRLLLFRDSSCEQIYSIQTAVDGCNNNNNQYVHKKVKDLSISVKPTDYDPKQFASSFNYSANTNPMAFELSESSSLSAAYTTAVEDIEHVIDTVWKRELELSLLDFSLRHFYPDVHKLIAITLKVDSLPDTDPIKMLLNITELLQPVAKLLKDPKMCSNEVVLTEGLQSIDVLPLVRSEELIHILFNAISNLAPQYDGNDELREKAESLLLHLFSRECLDIKRLIYQLTAEKMTYFFSCIMDGSTFISKSYTANVSRSNFLGLPLNTDILIEIICFGLTSSDLKISTSAENIFSLIIRSRNVIPHYWSQVCEFLVPVLPLLLCFATNTSTLGQSILQLVDPDNDSKLPTIQLIQCNVLLLFCRYVGIREEAIYRLSYLLQTIPDAASYMPNINYLRDVIPNNLCIVEAFADPNWNGFVDLYECSYVEPMLKLLAESDVEPSIRQTTLIQLNVMLQDPTIAEHFHRIGGLSIALRIFNNSLREGSVANYADNAVPIVGILAKLCIRMPSVRRQLANDISVYVLLIRTQLLFHQNDSLKLDCAIVLFSLAFNAYIVGGNADGQFTVPAVSKKLLLPIKCEFRWRRATNNESHSAIELLLLNETSDSADLNSNNLLVPTPGRVESKFSPEKSLLWRYVRMSFAKIWFGSLDNIQETHLDSCEDVYIDYRTNSHSISFNAALCLTSTDLEIIRSSSPQMGINHWLKHLRNATNHQAVALSCAAIENFSNVDSVTHQKHWSCDQFLNEIKRFMLMPRGKQDEQIFCAILHLLTNLVDRDFCDILLWILAEFQRKSCIFTQLLTTSPTTSTAIYVCNVQFIETILAKTMQLKSKKVIEQLTLNAAVDNGSSKRLKTKNFGASSKNFYEKIFDLAANQLDDVLTERKLDKLRSLVSLLRMVTSSVQITIDDYTASFLANKLLKLILAIKCFAQVGSNFNKNCLLTIGNLMIRIDELRIDKKYIKLLSSLCGHNDFEIRAYSWCILTKISTTLNGAELLIKELSFLPGGLHACCLSTLLDDSEPAIVRENAAFVFATLISYRKDNGQLNAKVWPMCANAVGNGKIDNDVGKRFELLFRHHQLFSTIQANVDQFYADEMVDADKIEAKVKIIPCDLVRAFCVILTNVLSLRSTLIGALETIYLTMLKLIRVVPRVTQSINKSSTLMLSEVCILMLHCFARNRSLIDHVAQDYQIVHALISFLNIDSFAHIPKSIKHTCWSRLLKVLKTLTHSSIGFQSICDAFAQKDVDYLGETFNWCIYGLASKEISIPVMKLLTNLFVLSQLEEYSFKTFAQSLNDLEITTKIKKTTSQHIFDGEIVSQSLVNWLEQSDNEDAGNYAVEILYKQLSELFADTLRCDTVLSTEEGQRMHEHICKTLEALFKCSDHARAVGTEERFLLCIVDQLEAINDLIGGNCLDFIRRNGNAKMEKKLVRIKLLLNIVLSWYSSDCLVNVECIQPLIYVCQKLWPCMGVSFDVHVQFMNMLLFISDDSLPVCKALATAPASSGSGSVSLMQLVAEYCMNETGKAKNPQANLMILELALRLLSNCCCCVEGRLLINKINVLPTLSRLHPQVTRNQKPWPQITFYWLQFYEVITRYPDSSAARHLNMLRSLFDSHSTQLRRISLQILRNMSFNPLNRSTLLISDDFLYVIHTTLEKGGAADQLLAVTSIWKLIAQNWKAKNVIKNSQIFGKLRQLQEGIGKCQNKPKRYTLLSDDDDSDSVEETAEELGIALKYVMSILQAQ